MASVLLWAGIWAGCGATAPPPSTNGAGGSATVAVSVSPTIATVRLGQTEQFQDTVQNTQNTSVTWSVDGTAGGSIANGTINASGLYTAPAVLPSPATITVTATSVQDPTQSASATVTLEADVAVSVTPATVTLAPAATQAFQAAVTGDTNTAVTWSVNGIAGGNTTVGTINTSGTYTAPAAPPSPATVTVTATSQADSTASGSAQVTIQNPVNVALSPTSPSLRLNQTLQFTATVTNASNSGVTWSVNGVNGGNSATGTISASGLYTAPAALPSPPTVTIAAASVQDTSASASTTLTLQADVAVTVTPATATLAPGATQAFQATVTGDANTAVAWSVNGIAGGNSTVGTINTSGTYTAPAAPPSPATVTVTATSQADSTASGSAQVTIQNPVKVALSPTAPSVRLNQTQQFTATVTNASNSGVTWSVNGVNGGSAATGTISASGLYTAPATLPSPPTVTIAATSVEDSSASASTTLTLQADVAVTVTPATVTLNLNATQAFQATITGTTNQAVTWSVNGIAGGNSTVGTINASGTYTAPAALPSPATVTVTATSAADSTASGSAVVTLQTPSGPIQISPSTASLSLGTADSGSQAYTITVPSGFSGTVQLAATGLPPNVTAAWDKSQLTATGSATLTLTSASFSLAQASVPVTITASSGSGPGTQQTATLNLTITGWKGQVHTLAGVPGGPGFYDGTGSGASLEPFAITNDGNGTLYFEDGRGKAIRSVSLSTGAVTTLAGSPYNYAVPYGEAIAWDASRQNLYISDSDTSVILQYHLGDTAPTLLAGTGKPGAADGPDATAQFNTPIGLAISPDDNSLYVADSGNDAIRKIDLVNQVVSTIAGQLGVQGSVDGVGASALLAYPWGLDIDPTGQYLYFCEHWGPTIRRVNLADDSVTTLAGNGTVGMQDGPAATATFKLPMAVRVDPHDNGADLLYIIDSGAIRALTLGKNPVVFTVAGQAKMGDQDGAGAQAMFDTPRDLTVVPDLAGPGTSSLFIADSDNGLIRRVDVSSPAAAASTGTITATVSSFAGQPPHRGLVDGAGASTDFSTPSSALFNLPEGITTDGKVAYIADSTNNAIRKIDLATHQVSTVAGGHIGYTNGPALQAAFFYPRNVLLDPTRNILYIADTEQSIVRELNLNTMMVSTIAGAPTAGFADGVGTAARFNHPYGMAYTQDGTTLYVADVGNDAIRKIDLATDTVTTIAGHNFGSKDGIGLKAEFFDPTGIVLSPDEKTMYITDFNNHLIRQLDLTTMAVTTIAGKAGVCGAHDGVGTAATLCSPALLATDGRSLFWGDSLTGLVRVMNLATGQVSTLIGSPGSLRIQDGTLTEVPGGLQNSVLCVEPFGVALAPDDSFLLFTDFHGNVVRILQ